MPLISGRPARAQVSLYPVACTCTVMLFPVTLVPAAGEVIVTCMCLAPSAGTPLPSDMEGWAMGIDLDFAGIGDWEGAPAAEVVPDEPHAAATSATAATPTPALKAEPGHERPGDTNLDMRRPPQLPAPADGHEHRPLG